MNLYIFDDQPTCVAKLALVEQKMRDIAASRGFTVLPDGGVVGRNAATGEPNPDAVTSRWADPVQIADGRWGFPSIRDVFQTTYPLIEAFAGLPHPIDVSIPSSPSPDDC